MSVHMHGRQKSAILGFPGGWTVDDHHVTVSSAPRCRGAVVDACLGQA